MHSVCQTQVNSAFRVPNLWGMQTEYQPVWMRSSWGELTCNNNNANNNTFVECHSAVASEALAEQVS